MPSLSSPQRSGVRRRNNVVSRAYLLLATSVLLAAGASEVEGATVRKLLQLPLLGGLIPSQADTPAGEQQARVTSFLSQNSSSNVAASLPPAILQQIAASAGLGALSLPLLGSVPVGSTDPSVKAVVAGLRDPEQLMRAAYEDLPRGPGVTTVSVGEGLPASIYDTQVYTVAFEDPSFIGFIFRGTDVDSQLGFIDVITDFGNFLMRPYTYADCPGGCQVHAGFLAAFSAVTGGSGDPATDICASMVATYQAAHGSNATLESVTKVFNAGHSLGGALATLGAIWAGEQFPQADVSMINAGAPRVGNPAFVGFFDGRIALGRRYRMVNNQDVVPSIPTALQGYLQTCLANGTIFFARDSITGYVQAKSGDRPLYYTGSITDHLNPGYISAIDFVLSH
ncbi:hypothetical protein KFL_001670080 [Klebsormidium nitens]|uniref:Fungal lipase-type domain-containing protein n=1 Tax=Klebsormidium nitens TaxID=105231 RepID=A0A1Y1I5A2_KLENI|nr:hypothetical protein KFL_001670080 [Klebsormidium nitens]|eukprot:GAQ83897.1 hypothetical protein KFL_001670080 [Klebsormidium nitens]